ncbi:hypothetical protein HHK36_026203 [Tetracentron sinense]|uniref:RanBP2-type domain-containing protein n=1 Tax=Tetracentron sinense TaxID=13715 RepID=A0A835D3R6_TETSI|nr:hypothetical protein HHK36_026203 [Tetracentron sinense]
MYLKTYLHQYHKINLQSCLENLRRLEGRARQCYVERISLNSNQFVEMMLFDGVFIIMFLLKFYSPERQDNDPINTMWMIAALQHDMILLENQLLFFVLEHLFSLVPVSNHYFNFFDLTIDFLKDLVKENTTLGTINKFGVKHILDLLRSCYIPSSSPCFNNEPYSKFSVTELNDISVKFKARVSVSSCLLDVNFTEGVLEIQPLFIEDRTKFFFQNLIALKQCHYPKASYVTSYALFMNYLVNTPKDAGSRREDDWTCPSCGNVNFSFRTTCNMRNCTQSRPADHNSKSSAKPLQAHQGYSSSAAYLGSGAPSSMYMGVPPYGSSIFNGTSLPPYNLPFSGGSAYHYDYGSRLSAGSPYPLHFSGPSPYASGSMLGTGGMYGMPPLMDRYGLGLPMGHAAMGARPGVFLDENPQNKAADATRDSDWTCPNCGNVNFSFRTVCNMRKCNTPKPSSQAAKSEKSSKQKMPDGSWKCEKCNNINYPFRTKCNRQNCGAEKPSESKNSPAATASGDDQVKSEVVSRFVSEPFASDCAEICASSEGRGTEAGNRVGTIFSAMKLVLDNIPRGTDINTWAGAVYVTDKDSSE